MLRLLQRISFRRGLLGTSRFWSWVAIMTTTIRVLSRLLGRTEKVLYRAELAPGQTVVIAHERDVEAVAPHSPS